VLCLWPLLRNCRTVPAWADQTGSGPSWDGDANPHSPGCSTEADTTALAAVAALALKAPRRTASTKRLQNKEGDKERESSLKFTTGWSRSTYQ
jgi:hypothetical protein